MSDLSITNARLSIRNAQAGDVRHILGFIKELADFEKLSHQVVADETQLEKTLFTGDAVAKVLIAELDGEAVGFALYFYNYSTFLAKPGLYLEDLYVTPSARGEKVGKSLLKKLAQIAVAENCGRVEWSVLDWNQSAIDFYRSVGAVGMEEWTVQRLDGEALTLFAG